MRAHWSDFLLSRVSAPAIRAANVIEPEASIKSRAHPTYAVGLSSGALDDVALFEV